jgi:hypothetical protein
LVRAWSIEEITMHKFRIALAVAILALAALSAVDSASALFGSDLSGYYERGDYQFSIRGYEFSGP